MVRVVFKYIFALLIVTLAWCGLISYCSKKPIGKKVCFFCLSIIPPVLGNMIIISATAASTAMIGCYIYYIGMDLIIFSLIRFTNSYCIVRNDRTIKVYSVPEWINIFLAVDVVQMLLNTIFGHAFSLQEIEAYGAPYFRMVPHLGQTFHRIVCYGGIAMIMAVFIIMSVKVPRVYREHYTVILLSLVTGTLWQTFYIFSRTPIDRSMIGFAVVGLLVFYFSIYYRPVRLLDRMLADIVSAIKEAVLLFGPEGKCIWVNKTGRELTGVDDVNTEMAGNVLTELFGDLHRLPEDTETEYVKGTGDDTEYYAITKGSFKDNKGKKLGSYVRVRDITSDKIRMEQEIYAANHDALTGVYNREYTFKRISNRLKQHELGDYYIASINICDFKVFNDVFGRDFGNDALVQVADWLRASSDDSCIFGRIGGDTFGSCFPKKLFLPEVLEKELSNFKVQMGNNSYHLDIHIGFCDVNDDDQDVSILFDRAFMALDSIRNNQKKHVAFFDKKIRDRMLLNQEISSELETAIEENQIFPYLQPIADRNGKIIGAEALVRWIHPERGFMSPAEFIPLFEDNGMIVDVDKHVWRSACRILAGWKNKYPELFISVNVSPKDFYLTDVYSDIKGLVDEYGIKPRNLRIEVTETSMIRETEEKMKILDEFRKLGFIVEMDDFGSGYSSLNMLKDMPVDVLKIDMKFLDKSNDEDKANIIVKNVIKLSEDLGIVSLTEGVETGDQFDMLFKMGCILFQGYYFSKPVPLADFEAMLGASAKMAAG